MPHSGLPLPEARPARPLLTPGVGSRRALAAALAALRGPEDTPVLVEGPPGAGKTTLLRLLARRAPAEVVVLFVPFVSVGPDELEPWLVGVGAGPAPSGAAPGRGLREGARWLLVDEAQSMPRATAARLGALHRAGSPGLRLLLAGTRGASLESVLSALGGPVQRVRLAEALGVEEVAEWIDACAAWAGLPRDAMPDAVELHRSSDGVPGRVVQALEQRIFERSRAGLRDAVQASAADPPETPGAREAPDATRAPAAGGAPATEAAAPTAVPTSGSSPPPRIAPPRGSSPPRETPPRTAPRRETPPPPRRAPSRPAPRTPRPSRATPARDRRSAGPARVRYALAAATGGLLAVLLGLGIGSLIPEVPAPGPGADAAAPAVSSAAVPAAVPGPPEPASRPAALPPEATPAPPPPDPVRVHINVRPWATVFVDGRELGETPLADVPLAPGERELRAVLPDGSELVRTVRVGKTTRAISLP